MTGKKKLRRAVSAGCIAVIILAAARIAVPAAAAAAADVAARREKAIRDAVLEAAVQCYAVEGVYPETMEYLETRYGLLVDHGRYIVSYECYAANQRPEVRVIAREG